jgi:protein gp37
VRARRTLGDGATRIGWHCEHVSEGCRNCYAERFNRRLGTKLPYKPGHLRSAARPGGEVEVYLDEKMLLRPLRWKRPRRIFVGSMTDIFADFVTDEWLDRMFAVMALCPQHIFQLLTKRPQRMRAYLARPAVEVRIGLEALGLTMMSAVGVGPRGVGDGVMIKGSDINPGALAVWPLPNVWLGTSTEDRPALIDRAGHLRKTPAAVRFLSCEPLIGDLGHVVLEGIDWMICGGESGPGARPMHPDWARSLRDQCAAARVPFFFKQSGSWRETWSPNSDGPTHFVSPDGAVVEIVSGMWKPTAAVPVRRCSKKAAGRRLDGVEHNAMPRAGA